MLKLVFKVHCVIFYNRQMNRLLFCSSLCLNSTAWNSTLKIATRAVFFLLVPSRNDVCRNNNRVDVDWMPSARSIHTVQPCHFILPPQNTMNFRLLWHLNAYQMHRNQANMWLFSVRLDTSKISIYAELTQANPMICIPSKQNTRTHIPLQLNCSVCVVSQRQQCL